MRRLLSLLLAAVLVGFAAAQDAAEAGEGSLWEALSADENYSTFVSLLEQLLMAHILPGAYGLNDLQDASEGALVTLQGDPLVVATTAGGLTVDDVGFVATNVENRYANGVYHAVERVLVPPSLRERLEPAASGG